MTKTAKKMTNTPKTMTSPIPQIDREATITSAHTDKIFGALAKAQGAVEKARRSKEGSDEHTRETWRYAGLEDVLDAVKEARADNNLAVLELFPTGKAALRAVLVHESGQWIDYGTYAFGDYKTQNEKSEIITRARRHFMKCIFGVVDQVDDRDESTANRPGIGGENMEQPLADDAGGRQLTDKEKRQEYQEAKDAYLIKPEVTPDGRIDYDAFVVSYEAALNKVKTMNDLSMLSKANNQTLLKMQEDRPDLFEYIQEIGAPIAEKLL